ncbi:hypothetical protein ACFU5O_33905 [Streptomyces sp. NPDC057445]|uniref:hypothetical protein n=1 Tax=Streptomyces sp. NPDC057445 TaxID=3346136 RepID=UPI003673DFDE
MGTDMDGGIESREPGHPWELEADLMDFRLGRDQTAWGALWNCGGYEILDPLFGDRGLPDDASESIREAAGEEWQWSHTWATWAELVALDWDAPLSPDPAWGYAGRWRRESSGELTLHDVVPASRALAEEASVAFGSDSILAPAEWPPGGEVPLDGFVHRPVRLTLRMLAEHDSRWAPVWTAMRDLAATYGTESVRIVVWCW